MNCCAYNPFLEDSSSESDYEEITPKKSQKMTQRNEFNSLLTRDEVLISVVLKQLEIKDSKYITLVSKKFNEVSKQNIVWLAWASKSPFYDSNFPNVKEGVKHGWMAALKKYLSSFNSTSILYSILYKTMIKKIKKIEFKISVRSHTPIAMDYHKIELCSPLSFETPVGELYLPKTLKIANYMDAIMFVNESEAPSFCISPNEKKTIGFLQPITQNILGIKFFGEDQRFRFIDGQFIDSIKERNS